jgi:ariadne-2
MENAINVGSQAEESDMECSDNDNDCLDDYDYYNIVDDNDIEQIDPSKIDPENFIYDCLGEEQVERLLNETVEYLSSSLKITPSLAKVLLLSHQWGVNQIIDEFRKNASGLLISSRIKPPVITPPSLPISSRNLITCPVCVVPQSVDKFFSLSCSHMFCKDCWVTHFEVQINQGISTAISCMARDCVVLAPEDFVLKHLSRPNMREKYQQFTFQDYVKSHPELRFCPGPNCPIVVHSDEIKAKRAICSNCKTAFCFQ